jgi:hypothetical protein
VKRLIAMGVAALVVGAPAAAAAPPPTAAKLQQQVKILQGQVKALQAQMKLQQVRERSDRSEIQANFAGDACMAATVADLFQATWATIDQGATSPRFKQETQVNDKQYCKGIQVTRPGLTVPPSISALAALIAWIIA